LGCPWQAEWSLSAGEQDKRRGEEEKGGKGEKGKRNDSNSGGRKLLIQAREVFIAETGWCSGCMSTRHCID